MTAKRKHRSTHEYLKYLKGELTPEERHAFERGLESDPFEREALEGMKGISAGELEEDLLSVHASLQKRLSRRKRRTWYYVAATVASLLIVGSVFLNIYEFDPETASEPIHSEMEVSEAEVSEAEVSEAEVSEAEVSEAEVTGVDAGETEVGETEVAVVEHEAMAAKEAEADAMKAGAAEFEPVAARPVEIEKRAPDEVDLELQELMEAPAPVAGEVAGLEAADGERVADREVVAVEAQPGRGEKKGRAMETDREVPRDMARAISREAPREAPREAVVSYAPGKVSGIVLSAEDMKPLPGASLVLKGSDSGLVSDMQGRFALVADQQEPATVIASYVGMETGEYQLAGGIENRVVMQPDPAALNEVVVVGYDADKSMFATGGVQGVRVDQEGFAYSGAEPEGGLEAYKTYIEEQIRFPAGDTLINKEVVVLKFLVGRDGSISDIQALRSPGNSFTEEAIRLLQEGPAWKPARNESGITEDVVRMRIVFKR